MREATGALVLCAVLISVWWFRHVQGVAIVSSLCSIIMVPVAYMGWQQSPIAAIVAVQLSVILGLLLFRKERPPSAGRFAFFFLFSYAFLLVLLTFSHTFYPPGGLGVHGGRAKMLYLGRALSRGFLTNDSFSTFQQAYPPGLSFLTLASFGISSNCGDWLTQAIPLLALMIVLADILEEATRPMAALLCALWFLNRQTIELGCNFYAESFMALCLVAVFNQVTKENPPGKATLVWWVGGMAGWFKNEGLFFFLMLWLSVRCIRGGVFAPISGLFAGMLVPCVWHFLIHACGATLYDYAPFWNPSFPHAAEAFRHLLRSMFTKPWTHAFAFPAALVCLISPRLRAKGGQTFFVAALFTGLSLPCILWIYALSRNPDFIWHLTSSANRLLWIPSLFLAKAMLRMSRSGEDIHLPSKSKDTL